LPIHPPELSALVAVKTTTNEAEKGLARNIRNFVYKSLFPYLKGFLTCRKILRHGADGFTSPQKEDMLGISIALRDPSSSAGFEPAKLGSNGKHDHQYTIENDKLRVRGQIF
jgi:hypothetical protein